MHLSHENANAYLYCASSIPLLLRSSPMLSTHTATYSCMKDISMDRDTNTHMRNYYSRIYATHHCQNSIYLLGGGAPYISQRGWTIYVNGRWTWQRLAASKLERSPPALPEKYSLRERGGPPPFSMAKHFPIVAQVGE
jgi:hypothetical protein